ncbi:MULTISPECIES: nitrate/nitrite response regulator protein NarP [Edwardsiella]|uniref:Nitrate/nitrite response regulator protein NarL n=2 Tax=Edwardsiella anguillarum TaxID=1821960 RepID=A0A076LSF2_9GAMM|nr:MULTISPECIES: nitrate/nitrite response regulator protein NarP [Edwardsiella]AKM48375.1 transcriptional regulator NarP [Edwardsiella sp. EA181011]GAJ66393.1 nitrate/nitrite response regulator protein [Edwardsiella piscicida]AIJ09483.1 nitrate/nitrite response regulator protein NarL [Edwardsiella anguillarum ET080813]AKR77274.1 nitrate/nitrite response regulator protein NarP [Edwardsiella sp. LADL05-105]KAB0590507.1 nitrate/nitrite response regulator protein NarP [Edwardsiella anguillarum]
MEHPTSTTAPFRVMIVDDHPLMRRGVRQLLELDSVFSVVAEASNGSEAIALAERSQPDLILLDLNMKGLSGLDTLKALRNEGIDARIIILTVSDARSDVYALVDAGADGYLLKDSEPEALLAQIRQAAEGRSVFSESVIAYLSTRSEIADPLADLTERELDVLQEVARGMSNKQIAAQLHISEETVKVHIRNLLRKLNVRSRVAATVLYLEYKNS